MHQVPYQDYSSTHHGRIRAVRMNATQLTASGPTTRDKLLMSCAAKLLVLERVSKHKKQAK